MADSATEAPGASSGCSQGDANGAVVTYAQWLANKLAGQDRRDAEVAKQISVVQEGVSSGAQVLLELRRETQKQLNVILAKVNELEAKTKVLETNTEWIRANLVDVLDEQPWQSAREELEGLLEKTRNELASRVEETKAIHEQSSHRLGDALQRCEQLDRSMQTLQTLQGSTVDEVREIVDDILGSWNRRVEQLESDSVHSGNHRDQIEQRMQRKLEEFQLRLSGLEERSDTAYEKLHAQVRAALGDPAEHEKKWLHEADASGTRSPAPPTVDARNARRSEAKLPVGVQAAHLRGAMAAAPSSSRTTPRKEEYGLR